MTRPGGSDRRGRESSAEGAAGTSRRRPFVPRPEHRAPRSSEGFASRPSEGFASRPSEGFAPSSIDGFAPGHQAPRYDASRYEPSRFTAFSPGAFPEVGEFAVASSRHSFEIAERVTSGLRSRRGSADGGYAVAAGSGGRYGDPVAPSARHSGNDSDPAGAQPPRYSDSAHPSGPLPPRPAGVWDRLAPRRNGPANDDATVASPLVPGGSEYRDDDVTDAYDPVHHHPDHDRADHLDPDHPDANHLDPNHHDAGEWDEVDRTGGLDVIGAHVEDHRSAGGHHPGDAYSAGVVGGAASGHGQIGHDRPDDDIPLVPYDPRSARRRRRRRPLALLVSLLVLAGLVAGIVVGGQKLLGVINPGAQDFVGQGSGTVEIRVREGDTLSDIARTLVDAGVIASIGPFVDAAEAEPDATGIQPGVYSLRQEMSGEAALDLLLDPVTRMVSRVTIPEGLTVDATFARIAESTGIPVEEVAAAAADPAALGLPAYANGQLEGFLFPATYDVEPDTAPVDVLRQMVAEFNEVAARLQLEQRAAAVGRTPYEIVVIASMIQSETLLDEERPQVAQVIYNRLAQNMTLGIDATIAYGLRKNGNDLTVTDLRTDGPYNTRTRAGLPPTPISSPGEPSLEAALSPSTGTLLFYVLESADGRHFFTDDYDEFLAARQRCAQAGLGCGG